MPDVFDHKKRSNIMNHVRSKGNKSTEMKLVALFKNHHISGWRRNYPVVGHPDFVFLDKKVAIFVDGCFWHGHDCRNTRPETNKDFWEKKRAYNNEHDKKVTERFIKRGWTVIRIWECELKKKQNEVLERIMSYITK